MSQYMCNTHYTCVCVCVCVCTCVAVDHSEVNGTLPTEFDPSSPKVLLLVCKWYGKELDVAKLLLSL